MVNLKYVFEPKNVAVIGVSRNPSKVGRVIFDELKKKFQGKVYGVNPNVDTIEGYKIYKNILEIPGRVDLAIIAIPAPFVEEVLRQCGKKGVKAVVVISSGFSEMGKEGEKREKRLMEVAKRYRMTLIGPNVIGVFNNYNGLDAIFAPSERLQRPKKGKISFISQSGAVGAAVMDWLSEAGIGIAKFVSYGNAAMVNEKHLLKFLAEDKETKVVVSYLEGIKSSGDEFVDAVKTVVKRKPLIVLKAGKSKKGSEAVSSHTGSMAGKYKLYSSIFRQYGVVEANDWEDLFYLAKGFCMQKLPKGEKVAIVTNGGGFGVLATDEAEKLGLKVNEPSESLKKKLSKLLPEQASLRNPIDVLGDATTERYVGVLKEIVKSKEYDGIILIVVYQVPLVGEDLPKKVKKVVKNVPTFVVSAGGKFVKAMKESFEKLGIPVYERPETALRVYAKMLWYNRKKSRI